MSLCCCSTAAGRGFLLPSILLSRRHLPRHPLLNLRTTAAVAPAAAAASISSLSAQQQRQVSVYVEALLDWNQVRPEAPELHRRYWPSPYARSVCHREARGPVPALCRLSRSRICFRG